MSGFLFDPAAGLPSQVRSLLLGEWAAARHAVQDADAVHAIRQHGKRSRALLRLVRPGLAKKHFRHLNRAWRDIGRLLGPVRDRTVISDCLTALQKGHADRLTVTTMAAMRRRLPETSRSHLQATLRQVQDALVELGPRLRHLACDGGWSIIIRGYADSLEACHAAQRRVATRSSATRRHEWRKRLKDVRYQTRLLRAFSPDRLAAWEETWKRLGDLLGEENDLVMTRAWISGLPPACQASPIGEFARQRLRRMRRRTDQAAEDLPAPAEALALVTCACAGRD